MRKIAAAMNEVRLRHGDLSLGEEYRNMAEALKDHRGGRAPRRARHRRRRPNPVIRPVRGGTDGSQLTFRGLPCPNLGTGGAAFHGPYEHISAEKMDKAVEILLNIVCG